MTNVFCGIFDIVSGTYIDFVTFQNEQVAKRWFGDVLNSSKENIINKHPSDYKFFRLADVDVETGVTVSNIECLINGSAMVQADYGEAVNTTTEEGE